MVLGYIARKAVIWVVLLGLVVPWTGSLVPEAQRPIASPPPLISSQDTTGEVHVQSLPNRIQTAGVQGVPNPTILEHEVVVLTNQARLEAGLPPLKLNEALREAARGHAEDMAENNFFDHTGSDGSSLADRINRVNYPNWLYAAENIAAGFPTAEGVVQAWLNSPIHRENILHPNLKEIGVGYAYDPNDQANVRLWDGTIGGPYYHYWVQDFGTRINSFPVIINLDAYSTDSPEVNLYIYGEGWAQQMKVSNYPDFRDAQWQPFRSTLRWTLLPGRGTRTVYVRLRDAIGLTAESSDSIELIPPTAPDPSTYGLEINDGAEFTNDRTLNITIRAPAETEQMRLGFSSDLSQVPWQAYTPETQLTVPGNREGPVTVYAQIKIANGWESPVFQDTITVDTQPPTGAVVIRERASNQLKLIIAAEDQISGVADMQVGLDAQLRGATWQPYTPVVELTVAESAGGAQSATVYVRLRDRAGNTSPVYPAEDIPLDNRVFMPAIQ